LQVLIWLGSDTWFKAAQEKNWNFEDFDQSLLNNAFSLIRAGVLPKYYLQRFVNNESACAFTTSQSDSYGVKNASELIERWGFWPAEPSSESLLMLNPPPTVETTTPLSNSIEWVPSSPGEVRVHCSTNQHVFTAQHMGPTRFLIFTLQF
jgi:hypothetical protein